MTLNVAKVDAPAPVMIVDSFATGFEVLQPGQEFTLTVNLRNIGNDAAKGLIVTFGGVDSSGGGIDPTPGASSSTTFQSEQYVRADWFGGNPERRGCRRR